MKIIINEIKKIFNLKMLSLFFIGSIIFYQMFIAFDIDVFPNGRPTLDNYNIMVQMIKDYGNEMNKSEFDHFKNIYKEKLAQADEFLSNNKDFNGVGVYSYEDYLKEEDIKQGERNEEFNDVMWKYLEKEEGTIFWELQEFDRLISEYNGREDYYKTNFGDNTKYEDRINEIIDNKDNESIFSWVVFENYNNLIRNLGICIIIGITFMLTPLFLQDKKNKIDYIQYSSKHGRKLFNSKLVAGCISALIITTIEVTAFLILYRANNTSMFFSSNISSLFNNIFWFDITFIQYIILTIVCIYIISLITAFLSMFISSKVNSYILGIGIQVPTLFILCSLTKGYLVNNLFVIYMPKYLVLFTYLILIIMVVATITISHKKEGIRDIKN